MADKEAPNEQPGSGGDEVGPDSPPKQKEEVEAVPPEPDEILVKEVDLGLDGEGGVEMVIVEEIEIRDANA